jgi:hypothetical protein
MIQRPLFDVGPPTWDGEGRDPLDRYYTPEWATQALLAYMGDRISGVVWEPCCGADMIGRVVRRHPGVKRVILSDVDPMSAMEEEFDFLSDEAVFDFQDWIVTNPPYVIPYNGRTATASDFVRRALQYNCGGVAMLLRLSWLEPCQEREDIFRKSPPTDVLILPRVQFIHAPGSNNMTSAWVIWDHARKGETTMRWHYE